MSQKVDKDSLGPFLEYLPPNNYKIDTTKVAAPQTVSCWQYKQLSDPSELAAYI